MPDVTFTPPDADRRLGFDIVRDRLVGLARTPYGRDRLTTLAASSDPEVVRGRLGRAGEMTDLVRSGEAPPLGPGEGDIILVHRLGDGGAHDAGEDRRLRDAERQGRQHQGGKPRAEPCAPAGETAGRRPAQVHREDIYKE